MAATGLVGLTTPMLVRILDAAERRWGLYRTVAGALVCVAIVGLIGSIV